MIKNPDYLKRFEKELIKNSKVDIEKNFQIVEALYKEAVELGIFPLKDPLLGLETKIKIAKVINSVQPTSK
jgi:predicted transcriptional regulator YheO